MHRLVRISPYDSSARRHTSFSSVWVYPVVDDNIEIEINPSDMRIDTYRSSGAGGQHVNTTDSAVRITHVPTGIVTTSSQKSQHQNREIAMNALKSRLYEMELRKRTEAIEAAHDAKGDAGWGNQIRSYVLHPTRWSRTCAPATRHPTAKACWTARWTGSWGPRWRWTCRANRAPRRTRPIDGHVCRRYHGLLHEGECHDVDRISNTSPAAGRHAGHDDLRAALGAAGPISGVPRRSACSLRWSMLRAGLALWFGLGAMGQPVWFVPIAVGFPLFAPLRRSACTRSAAAWNAASRCPGRPVLSALRGRGDGQLALMAVGVLIVFGFWIILARGIFAIFMARSGIGSTALACCSASRGLTMLLVGSAVGAAVALGCSR